MKKIFATILTAAMLTLTAIPAFAATTPYTCPNGNAACVENGACLADGTCINHETCTADDMHGHGHGRGGHGRDNSNSAGHCGRGRNR